MRAVEDDHVDRPGVQARRRVEPTGTNRPIGLIALVIRVRTGSAAARLAKPGYTGTQRPTCLPNRTHAVAQPCAAKSQNPGFASLAAAEPVCVAPVWWLERRAQNPIPSRTRPLNTPAPMVLCLKTRESRSPPDPHNAKSKQPFPQYDLVREEGRSERGGLLCVSGQPYQEVIRARVSRNLLSRRVALPPDRSTGPAVEPCGRPRALGRRACGFGAGRARNPSWAPARSGSVNGQGAPL